MRYFYGRCLATALISWLAMGSCQAASVYQGNSFFNGPEFIVGRCSSLLFDLGTSAPAVWTFGPDGGPPQILRNLTVGGNMPAGWHIVGMGDFNADGAADILWTSASNNGSLYLWQNNGYESPTYVTGVNLLPLGPGPGKPWIGDFNNDGTSDVLWETGNSAPIIWSFQNGTVASVSFLGTPMPPGWTILAVGDFNGDGYSDILWQYGSNGPLFMWLNNGNGSVIPVSLVRYGRPPGKPWIADFNKDGTSDILWETGFSAPILWTMQGGTVLSSTFYGLNLGGFEILGVGDYNCDGTAALAITQNQGSGPAFIIQNNGNGQFTPYSLSYEGNVPKNAFTSYFNQENLHALP